MTLSGQRMAPCYLRVLELVSDFTQDLEEERTKLFSGLSA